MAQVGQNVALIGCYAGGGKNAGILCLRHEGADYGYARAVGGDGVVEWGFVVVIAEAVMAAGNTAGAGS